jgi:hypothetical protein
MEFRRHSFRDERRRRVFTEEAGYSTSAASSAGSGTEPRGSAESGQTYSDAVRAPQQRRVIDLAPTRCWVLLVLTLLATSAALGLLALYLHLAVGHGPITLEQVPAVDLAARGNVAQWFSSVLLLAAAGLGVVIYLIRRHRVDDYRGRYRMWYWMVPLLVLASLDQVAQLQDSARAVLITLAGAVDPVRAHWGWAVALTLVAGAVTLRLAAEMSRSRVALIVLAAAVACRAAGAAIQHDWFLHATGVVLVMYQVGAVLLSNILLLLALAVYARYVYRDAHGEIPVKMRTSHRAERAAPARPQTAATRPAPAASPAQTTSATTRIDKPHGQVPVSASARATQAAPSPSAHEPEKRRSVPAAAVASGRSTNSAGTPSEGEDDSTLSRSERRRLRKLQRRGHQPT